MTQLTPHFTLEELTRSGAAEALGDPNKPTAEHLPNLKALAETLEQVRALFNAPVIVNSAYRNPRVNAFVKGVKGSHHGLGHAADFHVSGVTDLAAAQKIAASDIKFDQLILEGTPEKPRCVHLSIAPKLRRQILRQPGGPKTKIFAGLT